MGKLFKEEDCVVEECRTGSPSWRSCSPLVRLGSLDPLSPPRRAFEAAERGARKKEEQERDRQTAINDELAVARKRQTAEKEQRLAEQAKAERDEFERIIEVQILQEEAEKQKTYSYLLSDPSVCCVGTSA